VTAPARETPTATLPIAEIFGPTFQGEGPSLGTLAGFIRLGGCNLTCRGCDTPYTWDGKRHDLRAEITATSLGDILTQLDAAAPDVPLVVVTGGEPLLYQHRAAFHVLLGILADRGQRIEIETNGTLAPVPQLYGNPAVTLNVSPKLDGAMSDDAAGKRLRPDALADLAAAARYGRARFKFVCATPEHVDQAAWIVAEYKIPRDRVWVMPEGTTVEAVLENGRAIADRALTRRLGMTTRLHVLLWPQVARGR
jgi:7-carboxy-7-deazaguanine synthase